MAGHSHWAGIKHKKGRQDKQRAKLFSKLSREITVAAKLGAKDPSSNPRLRSAIQSAKQSNMPKDNIERAINKSEISSQVNYQSLRYEGFGPFNLALIIETLTDNKNRSASSIRTILSKFGGRLGENGSTSHLFINCGVLHIEKGIISDEEILEQAINSGAKDCISSNNKHEIITDLKDFYSVKSSLEKKVKNFSYFGLEWRSKDTISLNSEQKSKIVEMLVSLDDLDDVQNIFINAEIK
jgi:YebC/PmpR family DNA-binding regulatory protein